MLFRRVPTNQSFSPLSAWSRACGVFRTVGLALCFLALVAVVGLGMFKQTLKSRLQVQIQQLVDERLQGSGLAATIGAAVWSEGHGLALQNVSLQLIDGDQQRELVEIKRVFVASSFQLTDLVSNWPRIDDVVIEGMELRIARQVAGSWNVDDARERLIRLCEQQESMRIDFPVRVRDSRVLVWPDPDNTASPFQITSLALDYQQTGAGTGESPLVDQLTGAFDSELSGPVQWRAIADRVGRQWQATANIKRLQLDGQCNQLIAGFWPQWSSLIRQTRGRVSLEARGSGTMEGGVLPRFQAIGRIDDIQCLAQELPHPIHQGSCHFEVNNQDLQITQARCQVGYGEVTGQFSMPGWMHSGDWELGLSVRRIELTDRMLPWLPAKMQGFWEQFQPAGIVGGTFQFASRQGQFHKTIHSTIEQGSVSYHRFPYRLGGCTGSINVDDRVLTIEGEAVESGEPIKIAARIVDPGVDWTGWVTAECKGDIPINEKLLLAFRVYPGLEQTLRKFNSTGHVSGWGRVERSDPRVIQPRYHYEIEVRRADIWYDSFPWPIYNVNGLVTVENERTVFHDVSGTNDRSEITCNGTWTRGGQLELFFMAQSVTLDEELRQALAPELQQFWQGLRPQGTIDRIAVDLSWDTQLSQLDIDVEAEIFPVAADQPGSVAVKPVWFPYEFQQVTGKFGFHDNQIDIRNLTGRHGRTMVSCAGTGSWDERQWSVRLTDLVASNISMDRELLVALPVYLAEGIEAVQFDGQVSLRGTMEVGGSNLSAVDAAPENGTGRYVSTVDPAAEWRLGWDLDVGIGQASLEPGVPLRNVNGVVSSRGQYQNGVLVSLGELSIDSMMYYDIQVTDVRGPLLVDNQRIAIGSLAKSPNMKTVPRSVQARVFDGGVLCDGQVLLHDDLEFFAQATMRDANLQVIADDVSGHRHDIAGAADAAIRLTGNALGSHSIKGNGIVQLRNARIYKLPVILALLNVLRIQEPDYTAFDAGQIEFAMHGEDIELNKIELNGNTISLIGNGRMNLSSEIDLDFYTVMGRNRFEIPIISPLFRAGSRQILWIEVDGTLENPKTVNNVLPGLNDSLRTLFPELEQQQSPKN